MNPKIPAFFARSAPGRYWQVSDGPSSSLSIGTDNIPLGSYSMEVVIYHCRGKNKFIPLGYASTAFTVTGGWTPTLHRICIVVATFFITLRPFFLSFFLATRPDSLHHISRPSQRRQPERPELHPEPGHCFYRQASRSQPVSQRCRR